MKVIELLNKIANGEAPEHIRIYNEDWYWNNYGGYVTKGSLNTTPDAQHYLFNQYRLDFVLDKEVEIIEEDKKIKKIKLCYSPDIDEEIFYEDGDKPDHFILGDAGTKLLINKINEIIDYINGGTNGE